MATGDDGILGSVQSSLSISSMETKFDDVEGNVENDVEDDVENGESVIEQDIPVPAVAQSGAISDTIDGIEDMLSGDTTTADGTVIPQGVIVNIACILFGDFAATFIACAIVTNIAIFGQQFLHYDGHDVEKTNLVVMGIDAAFYLLTGCVTDWFGGYSTAMHIYGKFCFIGTCILPLLTFNWSIIGPTYGISVPIRRIFFYAARIVTGLGVCGIQATSPPFAARQIEKYGSASVQSCFHYIYIAIQCAPLLALTGLSFVQLNVSFLCGYLSTVAFNIFTMLLFKYVRTEVRQSIPDKGNAAASILACAAHEIKSKLATCSTFCHCSCCPNLCSSVQSDDEESMQLLCECAPKYISTSANGTDLVKPSSSSSSSSSSKDKSSTTDPATTTTTYESIELSVAKPDMSANASRIESEDTSSNDVPAYTINNNGSTITTVAKPPTTPNLSGNALKKRSATINSATTTTTYGSTEQSELATSTEILSESFRHCLWVGYAMLLLSCQVPYSIMRYQIGTSYVSQAMRMKPSILGQNISPSLLQQCLPLVGIAITPVVNVYIYPYISTKFTTLTMAKRIMLGIILATLSVFCAAIVETARMMFIERGDSFVQEINNQTIVASTLTLDVLIPQFVLIGTADVFIYITSLEFAFRQAPCTMQAIATGIFFFYATIGRIVAALIVPLINNITAADPWYPQEINDGHLNYYFLVLTAISLTNLITYSLMVKGYEEVDQYLCPDEETFGGGETPSGSSTPATVTAGTPTSSPNPPEALLQQVASIAS
ncbi:solute carrier family 15 member 4 [Strongylocentrotus purpuratus]|uniref:Uncharacterized protein n=1 Tax=Strongylocentrotus purpuratus TaxID=7668 RepID=A0A7M7GFW6_STRPU|nr:solute carrier family 15 member 4 [Strongylocentrotus purpuratus]